MKYAYEQRIGTETVVGTEWPIMAVAYGSGKDWVSGKLCNGTMREVEKHTRRYEAVAAAKELTEVAAQ